jgi:putative nucleotidyltransferase with HDIG domain
VKCHSYQSGILLCQSRNKALSRFIVIKTSPHISQYEVLSETLTIDVATELQRIEEMDLNKAQVVLRDIEVLLPLIFVQNDPHLYARALRIQGFANHSIGESIVATPQLTQAKTLFEQQKDFVLVTGTLLDLGSAFFELGDLEEALNNFSGALNQAKIVKYHKGIRMAQRHLGRVLLEFKHFEKALEQFQTSMPSSISSESDRRELAWIQFYTSRAQFGLYKQKKEVKFANNSIKLTERVSRFARKYGDDNMLAEAQVTAAEVYLERGRFEQADTAINTALYVAQQSGLKPLEAQSLALQSQVAFSQNKVDLGLELAQQALEMFAEQQARPAIARIHENLANTFRQLGRYEDAFHHLEAHHEEVKRIHDQVTQNRANLMSMQLEFEKTKIELETNQRKNEELELLVSERTQELEASQVEMIERLAIAAEFRDAETGEHTKRVGDMCAEIATRLGWKPRDIELLRHAARLHDIGKIAIPDGILLKPGPLTDDEREIINTHTLQGAKMLEHGHSELVRLAHVIALTHHERWDGQGYPRGIAGNEIPMVGRIVALADVFDALTHPRPYKNAWTITEAIAEVKRQSGKHFDPQVVEVFLSYSRVAKWPTDSFDHLFDPFLIPKP